MADEEALDPPLFPDQSCPSPPPARRHKRDAPDSFSLGAPLVIVPPPPPPAPAQAQAQAQPQQAASPPPSSAGPVHATLPRDEELRSMTSEQIEEFARACRASALLSAADESRLRAARRAIRNREYANQSRERRRCHVAEMESKAGELEAARARIAELEAENRRLREALAAATAAQGAQGRSPLQAQQQPQRRTAVAAAGAVCLL
eukprot:m51a1_g822 putative bzip transcription factor domain containing protein (205) ;mRNA; r:706059-706673